MFTSPYQTPAYSKHIFEKTGQAIRRLEMDGKMVKLTPTGEVVALPAGTTEVPPFTLFLTKDQIPTMEAQVVVDGRLLLKADNSPIKVDVFNFYLTAAKLILKWRSGEQDEFIRLGGEILPKLYGMWVKNAISPVGKLGLDFRQSMIVQATAVGFYLQSCEPLTNNSSSGQVTGYLNRITRAMPQMDIYSLSENLLNDTHPPLESMGDYVTWVKELLNTPRADALSSTYITVALANTWMYSNKDITMAAIEFPPLFAAIVYGTLKSQGFMKTQIGDMIKRSLKRQDIENYVKSVERFISN